MATTTRVSAGRPSISRLFRIYRLAAPVEDISRLPQAPHQNSSLTISARRPHATSAKPIDGDLPAADAITYCFTWVFERSERPARVARMERSEIRERPCRVERKPRISLTLHPGYDSGCV